MTKFTMKEALPIGISTAGLGLSAANYYTNRKRLRESGEYQEKQLEAMNNLTSSLNNVDSSLNNIPAANNKQSRKKRSFRFIQKNNSHTSDLAYKGAVLGGTVTGGALPFIPNKVKFAKKDVDKYNNLNPFYKKALLELGGVAIGGALGALAGMIMDVSDYINKKTTVNKRLLKDVLDNLKKTGYKEGTDFTRDPKMASLLKTKVCLVISKSSDELKLLINTVNDSKLKTITEQIIKNLPTLSTLTEKVSDRFNEINITTMASNSGDATWVTSVAEKFISSGYPVYLVEVG